MSDLNDKVEFIKQFPLRARDSLKKHQKKKKKKLEDESKFIKQVPVHPSDRLRKNNKQIQHLRNRLTQKKVQIERNNVIKLMRGELDFSMKSI